MKTVVNGDEQMLHINCIDGAMLNVELFAILPNAYEVTVK